jgi:hypothetical protein
MERINNFKRLMEDEEMSLQVPPEVERNLQNKVDSYKNVGSILDLYVPKIIKVMMGFAGGTSDVDRFGQSSPTPPVQSLSSRFGGKHDSDPASF